jgi:hypothetical protein
MLYKVNVNIKFAKEYLDNTVWNLNNSDWQVSGIIKNRSNENLKFDIRFLKDYKDKGSGKIISEKSKADKVLFEDKSSWLLIDTKELIKYMKVKQLKQVTIEELKSNIDWTIELPKA